jgi:hypothetical protein
MSFQKIINEQSRRKQRGIQMDLINNNDPRVGE